MSTDDTRKWNRVQFLLALGVPAGIAVAALLLWPLIPDYRYLDVISTVSRLAGLIAMPLGVIAALWNFYILARIRRMGQAALRSRDVLLQRFARGQRWLVRHTLAVSFLLILAGTALLLEAVPIIPHPKWMLLLGISAVLLLLGGTWALLFKIYPAMTRRHESGVSAAFGRAVSRQEAPLVWQLVDEVTRHARVVAPDNIVLGLDATFYAIEAPLHLNNAEAPLTGRSMYLSVPYLAYLERDEAAAIIGHELAHFTGADTEYTLKFSDIYFTARQHYVSLLSDDGQNDWLTAPVRALMGYYISAFDLAVQHWSREREFLADQIGAGAVTNDAAARALLRTTTLGAVIETVLDDFHYHGGKTTHPGGLLEQVFEAVRMAKSLDPMEHLEDSQPHPRDSHPPTSQRIAALGITPGPELAARVNRREPGELLQELGLK